LATCRRRSKLSNKLSRRPHLPHRRRQQVRLDLRVQPGLRVKLVRPDQWVKLARQVRRVKLALLVQPDHPVQLVQQVPPDLRVQPVKLVLPDLKVLSVKLVLLDLRVLSVRPVLPDLPVQRDLKGKRESQVLPQRPHSPETWCCKWNLNQMSLVPSL